LLQVHGEFRAIATFPQEKVLSDIAFMGKIILNKILELM